MIEIFTGVMTSVAILLLLEQDRLRKLFGIMLLSTTVNICILLSGRIFYKKPAFINHSSDLSNPLSQACTLTALVIGFGLIAFLTMLIKARQQSE